MKLSHLVVATDLLIRIQPHYARLVLDDAMLEADGVEYDLNHAHEVEEREGNFPSALWKSALSLLQRVGGDCDSLTAYISEDEVQLDLDICDNTIVVNAEGYFFEDESACFTLEQMAAMVDGSRYIGREIAEAIAILA